MSRFYSYINSATAIIQQYNGAEPLAAFLKKYFTSNKKYGSKDRKQISHLIYCYYRLGKLVVEGDIQERLLAGLFLCSNQPQPILEALRPEQNQHITASLPEKLAMLSLPLDLSQVFPWHDQLSDLIDAVPFSVSHLRQPYLFIRIRPGYYKTVTTVLQQQQVPFTVMSETCLALPNGTRIEDVISLNKTAVVQDHSSQQVAGLFTLLPHNKPLKYGIAVRPAGEKASCYGITLCSLISPCQILGPVSLLIYGTGLRRPA